MSESINIHDWDRLHPDFLYFQKANSMTFIYSPQMDKLWAEKFPATHGGMLRKGVAHELPTDYPMYDRNDLVEEGSILLGRWGETQGAMCISFWNYDPDSDLVEKCLRAIIREHPEVANEPEKVVVTGDWMSANFLGDYLPDLKSTGKQAEKGPKEPDACDRLGVNVEGRHMSLNDIIGNLHMVKGVNLEVMKSAFCGNSEQLIQQARQIGCTASLNLIDEIKSRIDCGKLANYGAAKKAGASALRADYQKVFSNPEKIDTEFRGRQKDIDAAWDYLQKGRNEHRFRGFKTWLEASK